MTSFYKFRTEWRPVGVKLEENACDFINANNATRVLSLHNFKNLTDSFPKKCPLSV